MNVLLRGLEMSPRMSVDVIVGFRLRVPCVERKSSNPSKL